MNLNARTPTFLGRPLHEAILIGLTRAWFPKSLEDLVRDYGRDQDLIEEHLELLGDKIESYEHSTRKVQVYQLAGRPKR